MHRIPLPLLPAAARRQQPCAGRQSHLRLALAALPRPVRQVTLRLREMLLSFDPRAQAWACLYLWLGSYSLTGLSGPGLWTWVARGAFMEWADQVLSDSRT